MIISYYYPSTQAFGTTLMLEMPPPPPPLQMSKMISKQTATVFFRNEVFTIAPPKLYYRSTFGGRFKRSLTAFNSWKILLPTTSSYNVACRVEAGIMRRVVL